ncbi:hypothetical protein [Microbacterium thalli]|uniref:hypothetical protein n=1 Tax=Microbacterium thalli TaxID=3027921 RepID=UPI0023658C47|nr:hypothetical protein [Microbacterium thalli]MDD7929887.1 hypothetical protein [Microbacterium thalli]
MTTRSIFVISPIGSPGTAEHRRYRHTLDYIVKKAFTAPDWEVVRADEETSPDSITTQVIGRIVESDLIVADLTDHNPNVFYELAVAHGYQKPVIHLMQEGQKVPFDVVDQRVIFYDLSDPESVDKARSGLAKSAAWLDENPNQSRNPLSAYGQFSVISSASGGGERGEAVAEAIDQLSRQVARIDARMRNGAPVGFSKKTRLSDLQARHLFLTRRRKELLHSDHGEDVEDELTAIIREIEAVEAEMEHFGIRFIGE